MRKIIAPFGSNHVPITATAIEGDRYLIVLRTIGFNNNTKKNS